MIPHFFPPSNWKKMGLWFLFCFVLLNGHYCRKDRLWGKYQKPSFRHANFEMLLAIQQKISNELLEMLILTVKQSPGWVSKFVHCST